MVSLISREMQTDSSLTGLTQFNFGRRGLQPRIGRRGLQPRRCGGTENPGRRGLQPRRRWMRADKACLPSSLRCPS